MKQYLDLMKKVLEEGTPKADRTGTGTLSILGIRCVSIYKTVSHWSPPSVATYVRLSMSCYGS